MEDKQIINSESRLLSFEENEVVFRLLGNKCKSRSTAVVQLYATMSPNHDSWVYQFCGVATFVKDFSRRSFFIQVYDIEKNEILFEQEIYKDFSYSVSPIFFHQFESENTIIGINFADDVEAEHFGTCILNYVERKRQKKVEMKETKQVTTMEKVSKIKRNGRRRSGSRRIRKSQIGHPENFRHIQHVGLDKGDNSPENILSCIIDMSHDKSATLGKPSSQQTTPNPFDEAFAEYSSPIPQNARKQKAKPQHPNPLNSETRSKHEFDVPPNIPMSPKPQKKSLKLNSTPHSSLPRPPPPPPGQGSKPPIQPPRNQPLFQEHVQKEINRDTREEPSSRSDLLSEIRNPKLNLRHEVSQDSREEEPSSRNDLLSQIRNPKLKLRHVDLMEQKSKQASLSTGSNNILQTMAKVLEVRGRGVRGDSDDSYSDSSYSGDEDDDDSDDW